ncbi:ATPase [Peptostreptococcus sp. MV1]|uniref:ATP-binding protein n=1 Tax=Peptostreptococcus sp. MV1 TaxID=1219626 RepID=UPI00050DD842|nr:AAA family ATPase [Peptostreptococcus sp. MV1]KGF10465.1 ATPase [Peptostreptococcus sp. MV1]
MLKRKIYDKLLDWKNESNGKTALLIEGARRIGKSTIVEEFAKNEYESYIIIDFAFASADVQDLFLNMNDLNYFFLQLQLLYGVGLEERKSLIVFDEVQFNPRARQAIKLLVADGRYDYIETGSLISINKNVKDILIPSEERRIQMYPMDFEEFLWAIGDMGTMKILKSFFEERKSLGQVVNREILRKFRLYILVGGMPQSVLEYLESNNLEKVDRIKRDIIDLYEQDFYKIDDKGKISAIYESIPNELNKHTKSYQISSVLPNDRKSTVDNELTELIFSKTVLASYNLQDPNIGLSSSYDLSHFRLYSVDTGLLVTLMFKDKDFTENEIYRKILSDKLPANLGIIYENVVAQILASKGYKLYYHTYYDRVKKRNYEIDFIISKGSKITPMEVKSSNYRKHKSLDDFCDKYSSRVGEKIVLHTKDLDFKESTLYLPVYMAQFI